MVLCRSAGVSDMLFVEVLRRKSSHDTLPFASCWILMLAKQLGIIAVCSWMFVRSGRTCIHNSILFSPRIFIFNFQPPAIAWSLISYLLFSSVADYDSLRKEIAVVFDEKVSEVKELVSKLQKTQRAAEQALDQFEKSCSM